MPTAKQAKKNPPPLNPRDVRIKLAVLGITQAELANRIGRSNTAVNLTINHNSFPAVNIQIRNELNL